MSYSENVTNTAKLHTACAAFAANPGLKTGTSLYDAARKVLKRPPPGISKVAQEMSALIHVQIDGRPDLPKDAAILLEQMVGATLPSAEEIVAHNMNAEAIARHMHSQLSEAEHVRPPMPQLFENVVMSVFSRLLPAAAFAQDLTPAFMAQVLENTSAAAVTTRDILETTRERTEAELREAASFFPDAPAATASIYEVMRFLELRAETLTALQAQFDALDNGMKALLALQVEAGGALQNMDIAAATRALENLQGEHLKQVVTAGTSLGEIFIKKSNTKAAHWVMNASSEIYSGFNFVEAARVRIKTFAPQLIDGAQRISPEFAQHGLQLVIECLTDELRTTAPELWGNGQNVVMSACAIILKTIPATQAKVFFKLGLDAFDAALPTRSKHAEPAGWAELHNNRSRLHQLYGEATGNPEYFDRARQDIKASLTVYTRDTFPFEHARSTINLASIYFAEGLSQLNRGEEAGEKLKLAKQAYDTAMQIYTLESYPEPYIRAHVDLGALNTALGAITPGPEGRKFLKDAHQSIETTRSFFKTEERIDKWLFGSVRLVSWYIVRARHQMTSKFETIKAYRDARDLCFELGPVFGRFPAPDLQIEVVELQQEIENGLILLDAN